MLCLALWLYGYTDNAIVYDTFNKNWIIVDDVKQLNYNGLLNQEPHFFSNDLGKLSQKFKQAVWCIRVNSMKYWKILICHILGQLLFGGRGS